MIYAYRRGDNYYLDGDRHNETYYARERIKQAGGTWDGNRWWVDKAALDKLGYETMIRVRMRHQDTCPIENEYLPFSKAVVGTRQSMFCGWCDGRTLGLVIEVLPE